MNKWCLHKYCVGSKYKKYCIFLRCCKCYSSPWWGGKALLPPQIGQGSIPQGTISLFLAEHALL